MASMNLQLWCFQGDPSHPLWLQNDWQNIQLRTESQIDINIHKSVNVIYMKILFELLESNIN